MQKTQLNLNTSDGQKARKLKKKRLVKKHEMLVEKMVFVSFTFDKKHKNTTTKMPKGMNLKLN